MKYKIAASTSQVLIHVNNVRAKPGPDQEIASVASVSTALSSPMTGFHR